MCMVVGRKLVVCLLEEDTDREQVVIGNVTYTWDAVARCVCVLELFVSGPVAMAALSLGELATVKAQCVAQLERIHGARS